MPPRKRYLCTRVRRNNGIVQATFERDDDGQPEIIHVNEICPPDKYEEGRYYWWYSEGAFPRA